MSEPRHIGDLAAGITGVGAWLEWLPLPELAALATLTWYGARLTTWAIGKWRDRS